MWFFDPPKAVTDETIDLYTTSSSIGPRLDASWNNPTQYRVAFDFIGLAGPKEDTAAIGQDIRDDYNFLPYFQGLKIQYLCYDGNTPVSGMPWSDVPQANLNSRGTGVASYWNNAGFLPKFIKQVFKTAQRQLPLLQI